MGFVYRKLFTQIFTLIKTYLSSIVGFLFGSFKKMPIRVGLAIIGSISLILSFFGGLVLAYFLISFGNFDIREAGGDAIFISLLIVLYWLIVTTFIPSLERQPAVLEKPTKLPATEIDEDNLLEA